MSRVAALLLALAAAFPAPAAAQSEALLDCSTLAVTPKFRDQLADAMLGSAGADNDALIGELANVAETCAARHGLVGEKAGTYFRYSIARLPRDALILRLGDLGLSAQVIDTALDFGPGRSNPVISGALSRPQVETLVAALAANGVKPESVAQSTWEMVGAYAAATSLMWQALRQLQ